MYPATPKYVHMKALITDSLITDSSEIDSKEDASPLDKGFTTSKGFPDDESVIKAHMNEINTSKINNSTARRKTDEEVKVKIEFDPSTDTLTLINKKFVV